jgi:hypothetical protein
VQERNPDEDLHGLFVSHGSGAAGRHKQDWKKED